MNKKQLIVAWVMGISLCIVWSAVFLHFREIAVKLAIARESVSSPLNFFVFLSSPVLIIGGLLIYTLRDKKK